MQCVPKKEPQLSQSVDNSSRKNQELLEAVEKREEAMKKREEALKKREEYLRRREDHLEERSRMLDNRVKRMATREKLADEKLTRLALYFSTWVRYRKRLHCLATLQGMTMNSRCWNPPKWRSVCFSTSGRRRCSASTSWQDWILTIEWRSCAQRKVNVRVSVSWLSPIIHPWLMRSCGNGENPSLRCVTNLR